MRNVKIYLRDFLLGFHNFIYHIWLFKICNLVLMKKLLHKYMNNFLGKNISQYLLMKVWFVISFVIHVYSKLESLKYFSQVPLLEYIRWTEWLIIMLYSSLLLNFHNIPLGRIESILWYFDSLLTNKCKGYLSLLEQSQNKIELLFLLKKFLRLLDIVMV